MDIREVKHRLRRLKRQEEILWEYAGHSPVEDVSLIWELFFSLRESKGGNSKEKAKYPLAELLNMDENAFQSVMEEYARFLYAAILPEDREETDFCFNPEALLLLGLPANAEPGEVKKRFRELAKQTHPDLGGAPDRFIELMEWYKKLFPHKK